MFRNLMLALLIGVIAAPAFARGGGSDRQNDSEKVKIERQKSSGKNTTNSPSLFDLFFGSKKQPKQKTK